MDPTAKHQFTLQSLIIAVTIISSVLGFAISYPIATAELITVNLLLIAPSAMVFGIACWISTNRRRTTILLISGIFLGWLLSPKMFVNWSHPPTFWDEFKIDFNTFGLHMFGGAVFAAILDVMTTRATSGANSNESCD